MKELGKEEWIRKDIHHCGRARAYTTAPSDGYITLCDGLFEMPIVVGRKSIGVDYSGCEYQEDPMQNLDYWRGSISYILLHELIHLRFKCECPTCQQQ